MELASLVEGVLQQERPENVDIAATTVTNEGPAVDIVIVGHRELDGVSLVAIADKEGARVLWAHVGDLSHHDDLDLGVVVERIPYQGDWREHLREALTAELRRPIRLRRRRGLFGARIECWIAVADKDRRIGIIRGPKGQLPGAEGELTTSLAGRGSSGYERARDL